MTWAEILIQLVVLCVGLPAATRNPTAALLVASWALGQGTWLLTGDNLPLGVYFIADVTVVAGIYAKTIVRCGAKVYRDLPHQLRCMVTDLTVWDRWIVAIFVGGCWPAYILHLDDWAKWHLLYWLTIAQFFIAGGEAVISWREAKRAVHAEPWLPPGLHRMAGRRYAS